MAKAQPAWFMGPLGKATLTEFLRKTGSFAKE